MFPSFEVGGAQTRTIEWINGFGPAYRHSIIAMDGNREAERLVCDAVNVQFVPEPSGASSLPGRLSGYGRQLRALRPDVLLTNNWGAIEWALANRLVRAAPHIHIESGFGVDEGVKPLRRRVWGRRVALKSSFRVVVPSASLAQIARETWRLPASRVQHIPDGIDCRRFSGAGRNPLAGWQRPDGSAVIGTVAVLRAEKTLEVMIDAVAAVNAHTPVVLLIAGDGPERARLEAHARSSGLNGQPGDPDRVVFLGFVADVEKVYPHFDVFVLSSMTEQMPNAVLQAMAAGLPVAATRVGDVPAMLGDENQRYLVGAGDAAGLAATIMRFLDAPDLRMRLGHDNQGKAVATYDRQRMIEAYQALFEQVLVSGEGTPGPRVRDAAR